MLGLTQVAFAGVVGVEAAAPVVSKFHITAEERAACGDDAVELCSDAYPDEDKLLSCMKLKRLNLSPTCRPVFDEGVRRRHLD